VLLPVVLLLASCVTGVSPREAAKAYYDLGNAYAQLGDQNKASAAYLRALQLDSSLFQASYNLARAYIESDQYAKATSLLDGLLKKDPHNTITLETLGYAAYRQGKLEIALDYYRRVLEIAPAEKNALYNVALILEKQGKNEEALVTFKRLYAVSSDPTVLSHMGMLDIALGDLPDGIHNLEAYRQEKGDNFDVLVALGRAYQKEQQFDRAISAYDAAIALKPTAADVLFDKATVLLTAIDEGKEGLKILHAAIEAGFSDKVKAKALASNPNLVEADQVRLMLSDSRLITVEKPPEATPPVQGKAPPKTP